MVKPATYQSVGIDPTVDQKRQHPIESAGILSKLIFEWATPLLRLGNERQLDPQDVWQFQAENQCIEVGKVIEPVLEETQSIFWTMARVFGADMVSIGFMQIANVLCDLYGPYVLQQIVASMESPGGLDVKYSLELIGTLVVVRVVAALLSAHSAMKTQLVVVKGTSGLQNLIFQKTLRLDATSRRSMSTGEISNYFSADIRTIVNLSSVVNPLWILPVQIVFTMVLLYRVIGWSTFVGVGVVFLSLVANQAVSFGTEKYFAALMAQRDVRLKAVNEIFGAIQVIKLNAWEEKFAEKLGLERQRELNFIWNIFFYITVSTVLLYLGPVLVTIASFASYTMLQKETLPASKLFTALSYFTMLKFPFSNLSFVVMSALQALKKDIVWTVSTAPTDKLQQYAERNVAVALEDASIGWDPEKPLFKNANLTVKHGEFVVIHGSVGEGKSSLCAAFLGEMAKFSGNIFVGGRIAYFSQQSWIQNLTIRENILFGKPYDREKYNRVIEACALPKDLSLFAAGDRAEIGQKGINLSGGQKARVCLARACYSDADIFILDSPLSAVDAIVQNEIFMKCFLGLLRNKTILLVTHSPDIIGSKYIDRLVEVKDGQLSETIVENQNSEVEPLIEPLEARPVRYFANDGGDLSADAPTYFCPSNNYSASVSPSISTPLHAGGTELFTPVDGSINSTFAEPVSGQLVLEEERNDGRISEHVYRDYLAAAGGCCLLVCLFVSQSIWQGLMISSDLWLNVWTGTVNKVTPQVFVDESTYYLAIYALLALLGIASTVLRSLAIYLGVLRASKLLFDQMTNALLRAPMRFYQNPIGRILNRYTNDLATMDIDLAFISVRVTSGTMMVVCTIATAVYMTKAWALGFWNSSFLHMHSLKHSWLDLSGCLNIARLSQKRLVSFQVLSPKNDPLVLKDVNVHIQSGEKIGIVGRTGAGKSSLTMALFRINELATGSIKIDGMDISKVGVKTLRSAIAIIPQTHVLFKGTLRNYLDPFSEFTDDELWSALQKVKLIDRISSVEGKLESPVEENGENFSVGERQMLCMARALLRQARIVVMDEATAAIDHETDQNLQRVIRTEFASSTVLTIAHRLDTVLDSDRILVFDQGRLVQCDSPKSLISQGSGIFFDLFSEGGYLEKLLVQQE
ncbi:unnamed protein product [Aphanomyces euteiches]